MEPRPRVRSTLTLKDCRSQHWLVIGVLESESNRIFAKSGMPRTAVRTAAGGLILSREDKNTFEGSALILSIRSGA